MPSTLTASDINGKLWDICRDHEAVPASDRIHRIIQTIFRHGAPDMTQESFAKELGTTQQTVSHWLRPNDYMAPNRKYLAGILNLVHRLYGRDMPLDLWKAIMAIHDELRRRGQGGAPAKYPFYAPRFQGDDELNHFVTLSIDDPYIGDVAGTHPELKKERERLELYMRWQRLVPDGFLYLKRADADGARIIAVSIVLPLTTRGSEKIWSRQADAVRLRDDDFLASRGQISRLMLDTWIVAPLKQAELDEKKVAREWHDGYGKSLLLRHVARFWDGESECHFLVEPDSPKLDAYVQRLGFEPSNDGKCYRWVSTSQDRSPEMVKLLRQFKVVSRMSILTR
jgi:hypothetical protein